MPANDPFTGNTDWTDAYASQILAILQESQAAAPDVPGTDQTGIVPPGAPASLVPPQPVTQADVAKLSQAQVPLVPPGTPPPPAQPIPGWTPQYANQIQHIAQQGFNPPPVADTDPIHAPATPGVPMAQIAPMAAPQGAPPGIMPPQAAPQQPIVPPGIPPQPPPPIVPPGPAQAPSVASVPPTVPPTAPKPLSGSGWQDKMMQMLPYIGAIGFGLNPKTAHLAQIPLMMGQMMNETSGAQQAGELKANIAQIAETQGPEAAKKYLVEMQKSGNLRKHASEEGENLADGMLQKKAGATAIQNMLSKDMKVATQGTQQLFTAFKPAEAAAIFSKLMPEQKLHTVGDALVAPDGSVIYQGAPKMKVSDLGGQDVTGEVVKLWKGSIGDFTAKLAAGDPLAVTTHQQAVKNAEQADIDKENRREGRVDARSRSTTGAIMSAASMQSKAMLEAAKTTAREGAQPLDSGARENMSRFDEILTSVADVRATKTDDMVGPGAAAKGYIASKLGVKGEREAYMDSSLENAKDLVKRLRTGAAISGADESSFLKMLPDKKQGPEEFNAQMNRFESAITRKRDEYLRSAKEGKGGYVPKKIEPTYKKPVEEKPVEEKPVEGPVTHRYNPTTGKIEAVQ